ncbi:MAG: hypothetical protein AAF639_14000, partial [Chloroflexota bacterium]
CCAGAQRHVRAARGTGLSLLAASGDWPSALQGEEALDQIHTKKYYEKYLPESKPITLVGANFSTAAKGLDDWMNEKLSP